MKRTGAYTTPAIMVSIACLAACSPGAHVNEQGASAAVQGAPSSPYTPRFVPTATIKELMDSTVDPSADALWDSVAIVYSDKGADERKPRTDEEWHAVRRHAVTLAEATNLLVMDGRHAAPQGTAPGAGELAPSEIDRRIAANRPAFAEFAQGLRATAVKALDAIDRKDSEALLQVGGEIDQACEACHVTYWYPDQAIPRT
jgi:hypothetical protein